MTKKLYVGNLSFQTNEEMIRDLFAVHGEVYAVSVITDRETGKSRGFAFVEMENADTVVSKLNGMDWDGRALRINEALPDQIRNDRPQRRRICN